MHTTADLHAWEDAYDYDEAAAEEEHRQAMEADAERIAASPYLLAKWLETYGVMCGFDDEKSIRVAGDRLYLTDALILAACHPDPTMQRAILDDCRAEIVKCIAGAM